MSFYQRYPKTKTGLEYKKYRTRGNIRTFRDLEVYKKTTELSSQIFQIELPPNLKSKKRITEETQILYNISKHIPRLIAESYGDRFTDKPLAYKKLERAMQIISNAITKLDFLINSIETQEIKTALVGLIKQYEKQKLKILNLKRAWERFEKRI